MAAELADKIRPSFSLAICPLGAHTVSMRMSIYVADDLKRRMKKAEKSHKVNWSALACAAFTERLDALKKEQKGATMNTVIERLRQSKLKSEDSIMATGRKAGRHWAETRAEAPQLERLERARDPDDDWHFGVAEHGDGPPADRFYYIIEPAMKGEYGEAASFWECQIYGTPETHKDPTYVQGFAEGAMEIWEAVKDQL
jgi:hypothetical protein